MAQDRPKVLIIDDDGSVRRSLHRLLHCAGYDVEALEGSEAYLAHDAPSPPACLVVDMKMPGMSGLDLYHAIVGTPRELPVVFITGHGDQSVRKEAMAEGAVDVLFKPLDGYVLLEAIARALKLSPPVPATP
jgi:FixJ family two-component response regulator